MPRSFPRASFTASAPGFPVSRHGAAWRASAAIPATWGAAADVPKNGLSKAPAAVTLTPSMPAMSGFVRPSIVGPWLLKNSIVEFDPSLHDSSGAALPANTPRAADDAEQIAPTDTTLTGVP